MRVLLVAAVLVAGFLAGCVQPDSLGPGTPEPQTAGVGPLVTIAHVDTGINPYHVVWRTDDARALQHPSTYLPGYPSEAKPLNLTLDAADYDSAVAADSAIWEATEADTLYYVPGTRIVGMVNLGGPLEPDDHGHGTMTASRSAGPDSLSPNALFVSVQGLGANGVAWIAEQGWIDVQTNSWGSLVPLPGAVPGFTNTPNQIASAATRMPVVFASGNGNGFNGVGPNPTWASQTAPPGTIQVGAHDNGRINLYHGIPAHVVADGFGGPHADGFSLDAYTTDGVACCTSAAAPYAAGGVAALVLHARILLNDNTPGITDGANGERVIASAEGIVATPPSGPLADGVLTVTELIDVFLHTARIPVREGPHDGAMHWGAQPTTPDPNEPGGNPYCAGCWATPVRWADVPAGVPVVQHVGYGAIDPDAAALGVQVLRGAEPIPPRPFEDLFFEGDATVRGFVYP